jgi:ectoine hydroxylase-related dioxygenase (phytanoyl-CoA dioxygenase family)
VSEEQDLKNFQEDGYVVWLDLLSQKEVDELRVEADRIVNWAMQSSVEKGAWNPRMDVALDEGGATIVRSVNPMLDLSPKIAALAQDARIQSRVQALLGSEVILVDEKLNCKIVVESNCGPPNVGSGGWTPHQDWGYLRHVGCPDVAATFVIVLDDARDRGPIVLFPGSHLMTPAYEDPDPAAISGRIDTGKMQLTRTKEITEPPGSVVAFDIRLVHLSKPNPTLRPRRLLIFAFASRKHGATEATRRDWQFQRARAAARFESPAGSLI